MVTYADGVKDAAAQYGIAPADDEPKPKHKSWLPTVAAAGLGGFAAYKGLRSPSFSANTALRKVQEQATAKGFHRVVDVSQRGDLSGHPLLRRMYFHTLPQVNAQGELNALNKAKLWFHEGHSAIPIAMHPQTNKPVIPGSPGGVDVKGLVMDRTSGPAGFRSARNLIRGGRDLEGSATTQNALTHMEDTGKGFETDLLLKHAPGSVPKSFTDLGAIVGKNQPGITRARRAKMVQTQLAAHAKTQGVDHFALKPTHGIDSGGEFATSRDNWPKLVREWDTHMRDPAMKAGWNRALKGTKNDVSDYLHEHGLYPHHTVNSLLKDPTSIYAQHWLPGATGKEWRVHTVNGTAPTEMVMPRHVSGSMTDAAMHALGSGGREREEIRKFVEQQVLGKLPAKYRKGMYGMDVMPFRKPDGTIEFKVMELNPHSRGSEVSGGGGSGMLDPTYVPGAGWEHYRAMTGQQSQPVAAAGALGASALAGTAARFLTPEDDAQGPT